VQLTSTNSSIGLIYALKKIFKIAFLLIIFLFEMMKVACVQLNTGENYKLNIFKLIRFINLAIKNESDLIITPEASSILSADKKKIIANSYSMDKDPLIKEIKTICKNHKKWILIGSLFIKERKKIKNRSIMINSKGRIEGYYDKINMFDVKLSKKEIHKESDFFTAGKKLKSINLPWGKLGLTICYDLRFPELYRKLSKKKLNFISVPAAFTKITGKKHWIPLLRARAIENFCYIFAPAQTGKNNSKRETFGHSVIISPDGKILNIKKKFEGIIYSKVDPELSMKLRKRIPSLNKNNS
jgi:deaminated glutathione amidase